MNLLLAKVNLKRVFSQLVPTEVVEVKNKISDRQPWKRSQQPHVLQKNKFTFNFCSSVRPIFQLFVLMIGRSRLWPSCMIAGPLFLSQFVSLLVLLGSSRMAAVSGEERCVTLMRLWHANSCTSSPGPATLFKNKWKIVEDKTLGKRLWYANHSWIVRWLCEDTDNMS